MNLKLVEPLPRIVKDEVRALGCRELGVAGGFCRPPSHFPAGTRDQRAGGGPQGTLDILRSPKRFISRRSAARPYDQIRKAFSVALARAHRRRHGRQPHL